MRYLLDCEYELKIKEIDDLIFKKENKKIKNFIDSDAVEEDHDNKSVKKIKNKKNLNSIFKRNKNLKIKTKKDFKTENKIDVVNDLFEEIYGKFNGDYNELVEEHTRLTLKFEKINKNDRSKVIFITMLSLFVCWLMSLTFFFI